ncbi:mid1-interacting protein 1A-like [Argonauta hians]
MSISDERVTHRSILSALSNFVSAVNHMDSTVMIPSRLRDMEMEASHESHSIFNSNFGDGTRLNNRDPYHQSFSAPPSPTSSMSSLPTFNPSNTKLKVPPRRRFSAEQSTLLTANATSSADEKNLYNFYRMLKGIKEQVTCGNPQEDCPDCPNTVDEQDEDAETETTSSTSASTTTMDISDEDDCASVGSNNSGGEDLPRNAASSFKYHLRGLFSLLQDFTETAKYLSDRYESEVGPGQSNNRILSQF